MDSSSPLLVFSSQSQLEPQDQRPSTQLSFLDNSQSNKTLLLPSKFIWPKGDLVDAHHKLTEPYVDLQGFLKGDKNATIAASNLVRKACMKHGFFQVVNHGVDHTLLATALDKMGSLFNLPSNLKTRASKMWGFSTAHSNRFSSKLPWKETFSFGFDHCITSNDPSVAHFFTSTLGKEFEEIG